MKGGARSRSGPPPDPSALRRDRDSGDWVTLPQLGRQGKPPKWPLDGGATTRERQVWRKLWLLPQAIMWEEQRQDLEVALYVRRFVEAESSNTATALSTLVRQMADSLGLTTPGLRSNRWKIATSVAQPGEQLAPVLSTSPSARDRLRPVASDG